MATKQLPSVTTEESAVNTLILTGDISKLNEEQQLAYYKGFCDRVGLDFATRPFDYLVLQGKKVLYLNKSGAEQLNRVNNISHQITERTTINDIYVVTARAVSPSGRFEESTGAVNIAGLKGDALANAFMKAETKAKRRATLSLSGLGCLDESEIETIPNAAPQPAVHIYEDKTIEAESVTKVMPATNDWNREIVLFGEACGLPAKYIAAYIKRRGGADAITEAHFEAATKVFARITDRLAETYGPGFTVDQVEDEVVKAAFREFDK